MRGNRVEIWEHGKSVENAENGGGNDGNWVEIWKYEQK